MELHTKGRFLANLAFGLLALVHVLPVQAEVVSSRSDLDSLLGAGAQNENFEAFDVGAGTAIVPGGNTLDSTTVLGGQGPGLVIPGFQLVGVTLQWNGAGYFGQPSKDILSNGGQLTVEFTSPANALGLDLLAYSGYPATATATVYAADDVTVLDTVSGISLPDANPLFFGYTDPGGIGEVVFTQTGQTFSPIIDNLEFGEAAAAPEPGTLPFIGVAFAALCIAQRLPRLRRLS